jgi:hypothetical protein
MNMQELEIFYKEQLQKILTKHQGEFCRQDTLNSIHRHVIEVLDEIFNNTELDHTRCVNIEVGASKLDPTSVSIVLTPKTIEAERWLKPLLEVCNNAATTLSTD